MNTKLWPKKLDHYKDGDRQRHGNASFNPQYFERVCKLAMKKGCGVAFMHSHPFPGWQNMSDDDVIAEKKMMGAIASLTDLPLFRYDYGFKWCLECSVLG